MNPRKTTRQGATKASSNQWLKCPVSGGQLQMGDAGMFGQGRLSKAARRSKPVGERTHTSVEIESYTAEVSSRSHKAPPLYCSTWLGAPQAFSSTTMKPKRMSHERHKMKFRCGIEALSGPRGGCFGTGLRAGAKGLQTFFESVGRETPAGRAGRLSMSAMESSRNVPNSPTDGRASVNKCI